MTATDTARAHARSWAEPVARAGYVTKGVIYAIIGGLALQAAIGSGGATTGATGAVQTIGRQPLGRVLLGVTAAGLACYVLWRLVQALLDPERKGTDKKAIGKRIGYGVSGLAYGGVALLAARAAWSGGRASSGGGGTGGGGAGGGGSGQQEAWTAKLLAQPFGPYLVGAVGVIIGLVGLYHFKQAAEASFMKHYRPHQMDEKERRIAKRVGQAGLIARGITFGVIAWFLVRAAVQFDASEAKGLGEALQTLARQPYGQWLLGIVAVGLIAYGAHCGMRARYYSLDVQRARPR